MEKVFSMVSQSLFHQVSIRSLDAGRQTVSQAGRNPFFIRSVFVPRGWSWTSPARCVAIPFSSGQYSFPQSRPHLRGEEGRNPFFIRSVFVPHLKRLPCLGRRRNPFFIRSVFVRWPGDSSSARKCRNPFFIRSVFVPAGRR